MNYDEVMKVIMWDDRWGDGKIDDDDRKINMMTSDKMQDDDIDVMTMISLHRRISRNKR